MVGEVCADGPYAIVLAPTRELAQQIEAETRKLASFTGYVPGCVANLKAGRLERCVVFYVSRLPT